MNVHKTVVEVHGNDGTSHLTAAKNHVRETEPDVEDVIDARYGVGRCEHGVLLVEVSYTKKDDR